MARHPSHGPRHSGVLHVVTQVLLPPNPIEPAALTVHANLPAGDVTAVGAPGIDYLVHGAGTATINFDISVPPNPIVPPSPIVPGFVLMTVGQNKTPPSPIAPVDDIGERPREQPDEKHRQASCRLHQGNHSR